VAAQVTREVKTTDEQVGDTNVKRQTVDKSATVSTSVMVQRAVWFIVGFIVTLLALRILLLLLAANQGNAFVDFIYTLSGVFAAPFYGIFNYQPEYGSFVFEISSVVAILIYTLVGWGIAKLLTLGSTDRDAA
jgi:hypothetical protein